MRPALAMPHIVSSESFHQLPDIYAG